MNVRLAAQVVEFVRTRAPEPRRRLREALRGLSKEKGDIKSLQADLNGYCRLRCGSYRFVFAYRTSGSRRQIDVIFCEHRSVVYEAFSIIARQLR